MDQDFWHQRWQLNQIGFHSDKINPHLEKYWPKLTKTSNDVVFVPLCGKSKDLLWLLAQGHQVIGVELSQIAVNAFFSENELEPAVFRRDGFCVYEINNLQIWCGDYFDLLSKAFDRITLVYDRGSLVALPSEMRDDYVSKLRDLIKSDSQILLISFDYDQSEMSGPPFSVKREEIEKLYGSWCNIELLEVQNVLNREPQFKSKGISKMEEFVYKLIVV